jgi:nitrate reductase NapE
VRRTEGFFSGLTPADRTPSPKQGSKVTTKPERLTSVKSTLPAFPFNRQHSVSTRDPKNAEMNTRTPPETEGLPATPQEEARSFAFLTIVMVPALTVMGIAAYGCVVWFLQMLSGPPGH